MAGGPGEPALLMELVEFLTDDAAVLAGEVIHASAPRKPNALLKRHFKPDRTVGRLRCHFLSIGMQIRRATRAGAGCVAGSMLW